MIGSADFLWLVCPRGYLGASAVMEIGFAVAATAPVFGTHPPSDLTLRKYVSIIPALHEIIVGPWRTTTVPLEWRKG